jgi:hypothetical protein
MYIYRSSCKVPLFLSDFNESSIVSTDFRKNLNIRFHENIRPVEAMFHADEHTYTNRRDEANVHFHALLRKRFRNCVGADVCGQIPPPHPPPFRKVTTSMPRVVVSSLFIQGDTKKRELLKSVVAAMYTWQHCGTGDLELQTTSPFSNHGPFS